MVLYDKDSGAWIFEHYDSLPQKLSSDFFYDIIEMKDILRYYLGWLLQVPIVTVTVKEKVCRILRKPWCGMYDRLIGD